MSEVDRVMNTAGMGRPLGYFDMRDLEPWVQRAINAYSERMRVTNFTKVGNRMFTRIVEKAIYGESVYFIMTSNNRKSSVETTKVPVNNPGKDGKNTQNVDDGSADGTDESGYTIIRKITSGTEPVDIECLPPGTTVKYDSGSVSQVDFAGNCYDSNGEQIKGLYCLRLDNPPITDSAKDLATRGHKFDYYVTNGMRDVVLPTKTIRGQDSNVKVEQDPDKKVTDYLNIPHTENSGGQVVVPQVDILEQWDSDKMSYFQAYTALEFIGEVSVPPVNFPEVGTLSQTTQSLVANREPFVSRVKRIQAEIESVFDNAGIPELEWQSMFPYTPQDIASIGDAYGKGVSPETLRHYDLS